MEEQWYVDRARLRDLRQQHPGWTYAQLADELEYSLSWVKKCAFQRNCEIGSFSRVSAKKVHTVLPKIPA